jgi:2-polyprenyl-6-methoxyphenol hydroxylase-like FAD-dependent oxidoreductase
LTAALALKQAGFESDVFEQAPELLDVGAAIAVWPNAMRILARLGVGKEVMGSAGEIRKVQWLNWNGKLIKLVRFPDTDVPALALHRADLQDVLLRALPGRTLHLGMTFKGYEAQGEEVHALFADSSAVPCDVLIGADGLHSQARTQLLGDGPPIYRGYTVWRGITKGQFSSLARDTATEIHGRGKRFGIGPVGRGRIGWWATANQREGVEEDSSEHQSKLLRLFAGWCEPVLEIIAGTPGTTILRNAACDRPPAREWGEGRLTLLGDAVHPTTPNLGQGGCLAIEDAVVLARCLAKYKVPSDALRTYERLRYGRTSALAKYSRHYGSAGQWENKIAASCRGRGLGMAPQFLAKKVLGMVFNYDAYTVAV